MVELVYYENRGLAEISRMLMTLADIEVSSRYSLRYCGNIAVIQVSILGPC